MNKEKKIERLERQLAKLRKENRQLKSDVRKVKKDSSNENKKRCQDNNTERRTGKVVVRPVRGHKFSELAIKLATVIYSNVGCGLRSVVKLLEIIDETFDGVFQGEMPSHTEISNWAKKNGLATYADSGKRLSGMKYCEIIDECITVGNQKVLLTLAAPSVPKGHPLRHEDVEALGIAVAPSWDGDSVRKEIGRCSRKAGSDPEYIVSDNGVNLSKGIRETGITHHRDISRSIGLILEDTYKGQTDFEAFTEKLNNTRLKYHLTDTAFLLPPKQRAIARFMNLFEWVRWAGDILKAYPTFNEKQQQAFAFVVESRPLIEELTLVMECVRDIERRCKSDGISKETAKLCAWTASGLITSGTANKRTIAIGSKIGSYLLGEAEKIGEKDKAHIISSDIIESVFGWYKTRKPSNKLCGVTASVLNIATIGKLSTKEGRAKFDFKGNMEAVRLADIKEWKDFNLLDNWAVNRKNKLKKVG